MTKIRLWCEKHNKVIPVIITFIVASTVLSMFMYFINIDIKISDVSSASITFIIQVAFQIIIALVLMKLLYPKWSFGFGRAGLKKGIKKYGIIILTVVLIRVLTAWYFYSSHNQIPSLPRILIEFFILLLSISTYEEILWRGMFLKSLENIFSKSKYKSFIAVIISAAVYGLWHIFGLLGQPIIEIVVTALYVFAWGVFFGAIYVKTENIWLPIIAHNLFNFANFPTFGIPRPILLDYYITVFMYVLLGVIGVVILLKKSKYSK
jgi:membrane protease YdiL (CAAX protease family)